MASSKPKRVVNKILDNFIKDIERSHYFQHTIKRAIEKTSNLLNGRQIERITCYGLGKFYGGIEQCSRYQLALLILLYRTLRDEFNSLSAVIEIYDPEFDDDDKSALELFVNPKFKLIGENEYCARKIDHLHEFDCTLFYMPHLDKYLYNNLLGANWAEVPLGRIMIFGNSFNEMISYEIVPKNRKELHFLDTLVSNFGIVTSTQEKALIEIQVDDSTFEHRNIFNSLSFHLIDLDWLNKNKILIGKTQLPGWCPKIEETDFGQANEGW